MNIIIRGAREANLKNMSLEIPKNKLVVLTGVSGSGKSTLAVDTLFNECQRQYLEAIGLQGIQKPKVDSIQNASPAILIAQNSYGKSPRSSVGTVTNIYTDLRMVFEKLHRRTCPNCHEEILASDCKEETQKIVSDFFVYMYCSRCGYKMKKLTRTDFSFNTREGACETCQGLGNVMRINEANVIHDAKSLEDGAVDYWEQRYGEYQIESFYKALEHYHVPVKPGTPVSEFSEAQKTILKFGTQRDALKALFPSIPAPQTVADGKFEGAFTILWRKLSEKEGDTSKFEAYFDSIHCPECHGERLNALSRSVTVLDTRLPEVVDISLDELLQWILKLKSGLDERQRSLVEAYLLDLKTKIRRIVNVGLGYLSLDRQTMTLSGGEAQRIRLSAALDSTLSGILYILDEPTIGLHPKDTEGMVRVLRELRDRENSVIVIEHDTDVMREADYIVDIGPGSGRYGGEVIATGTLCELMEQDTSVTGSYLKKQQQIKTELRKGTGTYIQVKNADKFNLKNVDVKFPIGCLTSVTGVSGSGKSTLVFEVLAKANRGGSEQNAVLGTEAFDRVVTIEQSQVVRMKRSNVATYSDVYSEIRKLFANTQDAKEKGLMPAHFSFNTKGGRCESCEGMGVVVSNMLFFLDIEVTCPVCYGNRFSDEVLSVQYKGHSINDVLKLSVEEALGIFSDNRKISRILKLLMDVGLGYLELGQTLTTLSGGEAQRLKLASELTGNEGKKTLYLIDEPTTGLHPIDVENFLVLLNTMVDAGNTVIVVEHNQQVIRSSDWIIDLGPEGGIKGGNVVATGTPQQIASNPDSVTGRYLGIH